MLGALSEQTAIPPRLTRDPDLVHTLKATSKAGLNLAHRSWRLQSAMAPPCFFFRSLLLAACLAVTLPPPACSGPAGPTFSPAGCLDPPTGVATFRPMVEELEGREGPPHFTGLPRGVQQRTYSGTDLWNSRGMNLTQAVRAMLGDPFAYYETALFTVYKMALLNQTAALPYLVYTW